MEEEIGVTEDVVMGLSLPTSFFLAYFVDSFVYFVLLLALFRSFFLSSDDFRLWLSAVLSDV